jgi:transcriptional regulator with XRE-family HTH domain
MDVDILTSMWEKANVDLFYREFGRRVQIARRRANLSQQDLARAIGLTRTSVTNIEKGRQHVPVHVTFLLAEATSSSPADLLPDVGELEHERALGRVLGGVHPDQQEWVRRVVSQEAANEDRPT